MTKRQTPQWVSADAAARLLRTGVRQVQRRAEQGMILKRTLARKPHERKAHVEYRLEDIEAIKAGSPNYHGVVETAKPARQDVALEIPTKPLALPAAPFDGLPAWLLPPAPLKPWLKLKEAAAYSGLPARFLRERVKRLNVGTERSPRWRYHRDSLDSREF